MISKSNYLILQFIIVAKDIPRERLGDETGMVRILTEMALPVQE